MKDWNSRRALLGLVAILPMAFPLAAEAAPAPTQPGISALSQPYYGDPFTVPGSFEAEDFDRGGSTSGYREFSAANTGGQYRPAESVDIIATADTAGGRFDVNNFQTGEWLAYTINVAQAGRYDLELRVSTAYADSRFRIQIDGVNVTGTVAVPNTGGWDRYAWVARRGVTLTAGRHVLRVVAVRQYFNLNSIRLRLNSGSTPYSGAAIPVPSDFEAEDFDRGGQGVAYRDVSAGNVGGQYRSAEDVDLIASSDPQGGGYVVNDFETGEWLAYTIAVTATDRYDLALRVASAFATSAFHIEIDGQDVSGRIAVPNTGSWDAFQWVVRNDVPLTAGTHVLKIVADQQYFDLNSVRVSAMNTLPGSSAQTLFRSGFEGTTAMLPLVDCWGTGCWQDLAGLDSLTNFSWPPRIWGGGGKFLLLTEPVTTTALTIGSRMFNRIETVSGPRGSQTRGLYQEITRNVNGSNPMGTSSEQNEFQFLPQGETSDLYVSYWLKLQPDLVQKMATDYWGNAGTWRAIFAFKTGGQTAWGGPANNGDYRVEAYVSTAGGGAPYWVILGDNNAGGGAPLVNNWSLQNRNIPVPVGAWFKLEFFWHRSSGSDGRIWMAANGQVIADRRGPNMGAWNLPINRIIAPMLYTGSAMPVYQWVDDIEIWDGFPTPGNNPPYAPH